MINSIAEIFENAIHAHQEGKLEEAEINYRKVLALNPDHIVAHGNLGALLYKTERFDESEEILKKTIELKPDYVDALHNLGLLLYIRNKLDEAEEIFKKVIELKPDYAEAHYNLGNTLNNLKKFEEAEKSYKKTIEFKPDYAKAHQNLGVTLYKLHSLDKAEVSYKKAIELKPDYTIAYNNLGTVYFDLYKLNDSEKNYKKAIELNQNFTEAYQNLGNLQKFLGKIDEALINHNRAYTIDPDKDYLLGDILHAKMHLCKWDDLSKYLNELTKKINNEEKVISPFSLLSLIDDPGIHRKASEIYSNDTFSRLSTFPKISYYQEHKKIKIGYFSADFRNHPIPYLNAELYETHDRKKFEIHAFSFGRDTKDEMNIRIKKGVDHFHDVSTISDRDVVELARSLKVDIAIDLGGFTTGSRQEIFVMSAAPIQVSYIGYSGTIGSDYMNYVIADRIIIPEDKKKNYSEKIAYLPNCFLPCDSKTKSSEKIFIREDFGLPKNGFVFCCFNQYYKISPNVFGRWMRILLKVEGSVLWLMGGNNTAMNNLKKEARKNGIDEDRLIFAQHKAHADHLSRIKLADLFLDTLPYNAHATASDALRMGVPVLTCIGNSFAGRVAASLLSAVELPEMITTTQEQYESLAIELAINPEKIKTIKKKLVNNLNTAALFNTSLYTRHIEAAYSKMYERYQNKLNIEDIEIDH